MAYTYNPRYHNPYYRSWRWMKTVCHNENNPCYKNYGGLGITMYWDGKYDYEDFLNWIMKKTRTQTRRHSVRSQRQEGQLRTGQPTMGNTTSPWSQQPGTKHHCHLSSQDTKPCTVGRRLEHFLLHTAS
jgi:hypothetical protein